MAIANVVTRGYGPEASIAFVVSRGYTIGEAVAAATDIDLLTQLDTDLAAFFPGDGTGFDQDVTGPDGVIRGIYTDEEYTGDRGGPHLWIKESDLGTITHGSTLTIESRTHTVDGLRPDGVGLIQILLEQ